MKTKREKILADLFKKTGRLYSATVNHDYTFVIKEWCKLNGYQVLSGPEEMNTYTAYVFYNDRTIPDYMANERKNELEAVLAAYDWVVQDMKV